MLAVSFTLSKILVPKGDELTVDWRGLPNEELYDMYSSPDIAPAIKLRRMEWARRAACMGKGQVR
jgi:ribonuclease I